MLLVCIPSYLKSLLRFLILDTYHPDTLYEYLREEGYEDLLLFFEAERRPCRSQWPHGLRHGSMATQSKAWVYCRLLPGIVDLNPVRGMDVCHL